MKKKLYCLLLIAYCLLAVPALAQTPDDGDTVYTTTPFGYSRTVYKITGKDTFIVVSEYNPLPVNTIPTYYLATADTMGEADSLSTVYPRNVFEKLRVTIRDTGVTTAAGLKDSLLAELKDTSSGTWITCAVKDLQADTTIVAGAYIIPGSGTIKQYEFLRSYPGTVRLRRVNVLSIDRKTPVRFEGVN